MILILRPPINKAQVGKYLVQPNSLGSTLFHISNLDKPI